jgi:hypothetical protein
MTHWLRPHSSEWFEALMQFNPDQALMTMAIIRAAGREDVCSICGDEPARDYEIVGQEFEPGAVVTIRLCDDCLGIRKSMYGEKLVLCRKQAEERKKP